MSEPQPVASTAVPANLQPVIFAICNAAAKTALTIARAGLDPGTALDSQTGKNAHGDTQKELDILADNTFFEQLRGCKLRFYASEERENIHPVDPDGTLALAIDPLDGSSNIGVNAPVGTIFSLYEAKQNDSDSFLRPGHEQIAAGYINYGPQTTLTLTFKNGIQYFVLDPHTRAFVETDTNTDIPEHCAEFAVNSSNHRHWPPEIRSYIEDCLLGQNGRLKKNYNMRWVASLVSETQRIMTRGGIFLYPGDAREGYANGRLRLLYECAPIAMLVEQAGGAATNGTKRLLDLKPDHIHAKTSFVFGSAAEVCKVAGYFDAPTAGIQAKSGQTNPSISFSTP